MKNVLEAPYLERGQSPVWRLTPLAPPGTDESLAAAGYRRIDESLVQVATLDERFVMDPQVLVASSPSPAWLAGFAEFGPVAPPHRKTMERMLRSIVAPVGFFSVEDADGPMAFALGVADGEHVGLFDVLVATRARRQGLARRLTRSIGAWGKDQGARAIYLQVGRDQRRRPSPLCQPRLRDGLLVRVSCAIVCEGRNKKWRSIRGKRAIQPG